MKNNNRWQPVVLVLNKRLECKCGALAVFVNGKVSENPREYSVLKEVDVWCQNCWQKSIEETWDETM